MNKENEETLKKAFKNGFQKSFNNGMLQAGSAICKVIYDKATNVKQSPEERIADIIKFCEVSLGNKKQKG